MSDLIRSIYSFHLFCRDGNNLIQFEYWKAKCSFKNIIVCIVLWSGVGEQKHNYYFKLTLEMNLSFSKKKKMEKKYSANEKLLYHGTSFDVADAICHQNFDSRLCGKNATLYGKGAYFSKSASYSHNYSTDDSKGHYYMFVAQVLVGRYTAVGNILLMHSSYNTSHHFFIAFSSWDIGN